MDQASPFDAPAPQPRPNRPPRIPGYTLEGVLGRGSTGTVYRGRQLAVDREVAVKVLHPELSKKPRGLILVTGPTGSGKSTTLASIIDSINRERNEHIVTIEDPIEYLHPHKGCIVNQREIGSDSESFKAALKYILRQDPDVVLIGELRDLETISLALTAAACASSPSRPASVTTAPPSALRPSTLSSCTVMLRRNWSSPRPL